MVDLRKYTYRKGSTLKKIHLIVIALTLLVLGGMVLFAVSRNPEPESVRTVLYDDEENRSVEDQLITVPKDAKSAVCDAISLPKLEDILGQKTNGARVSIPNTANTDGSVSACAYTVNGEQKQDIRSVIIATRIFNDSTVANKAYDTLTRLTDINRKDLGPRSFYNVAANQLVVLKDNKLHNVTLAMGSSKSVDKALYEKLLTLL